MGDIVKSLGQPSVERKDVNAAALPGLTPQIEQLLKGFLANPQSVLNQFQQPSALQQQTGDVFTQFLNNLAGPRQTGVANSAIQDILGGGQSVLNAAKPVFEQNLQIGADTVRQSGPRFASSTNQQVADLSQRSINDFNLFAQQVLESGQSRQLQALLGGLQGAGNFANSQQQLQLPLIQQLLGGAFNTGVGPAVITQGGSAIDLIGQLGGTIAGFTGGDAPDSPSRTQFGPTPSTPPPGNQGGGPFGSFGR